MTLACSIFVEDGRIWVFQREDGINCSFTSTFHPNRNCVCWSVDSEAVLHLCVFSGLDLAFSFEPYGPTMCIFAAATGRGGKAVAVRLGFDHERGIFHSIGMFNVCGHGSFLSHVDSQFRTCRRILPHIAEHGFKYGRNLAQSHHLVACRSSHVSRKVPFKQGRLAERRSVRRIDRWLLYHFYDFDPHRHPLWNPYLQDSPAPARSSRFILASRKVNTVSLERKVPT